MRILAIETSCDDTGIVALETKGSKSPPAFNVLSNIVSSQIEVHKKYGGIFPAMAKREHQKNLLPAFITALREARLIKTRTNPVTFLPRGKKVMIEKILERESELFKKFILFLQKYAKPDVDLIAVTNGPGLEPCLWVGVNFAKALSYFWDIPIIPVNHIESHILVNFLENPKIKFPAIALVVSGGHTQIILVNGIGKYKILGETRDDAAGECFDKCAKILGLDYPGGPEIAKLATEVAEDGLPPAGGSPSSARFTRLPRPMINTKDYDFSFSGLKTAVLYHHQKQDKKTQKNKNYISQMAAEIQQAIIDVLLKKTIKAIKDYKAKSLILGGGVSANQELGKQFQKALALNTSTAVEVFMPPANLSTDNALMTAVTAYFHRNKKVATSNVATLKAEANLRIK